MHKYIKIFKISLPDVLCSSYIEKQSGLIINSVCVCVCVCVRACVRAFVRACVCVIKMACSVVSNIKLLSLVKY